MMYVQQLAAVKTLEQVQIGLREIRNLYHSHVQNDNLSARFRLK